MAIIKILLFQRGVKNFKIFDGVLKFPSIQITKKYNTTLFVAIHNLYPETPPVDKILWECYKMNN